MMKNKHRTRFQFHSRHRRNRGLTLLETLISASLLLVVMYIAITIYNNVQRSWMLAQQEAQLQQYSRSAMARIALDFRQATRFSLDLPEQGQTYSYDVQMTIPDSDTSTGAPLGTYTLVRFWYQEDSSTKVWSLYRAYKSNGNTKNIPEPYTKFIDNKVTLLKEAAVVNPGQESYFYRGPDKKKKLLVRLVTATYKPRSDGLATTAQEQVLLRTFRVETELEGRNLEE